MVPLCSAGRTVYRGRKPPQRFQPQHDRPWRASDKPARAATIFTHNGAPKALVGCLVVALVAAAAGVDAAIAGAGVAVATQPIGCVGLERIVRCRRLMIGSFAVIRSEKK